MGLLDKLRGKKAAARKAVASSVRAPAKERQERAGAPVSYKRIQREFGDEFQFAPEAMRVDECEIDFWTSGARHDIEAQYRGADITAFESTKYKTILRLSLSIPAFDSHDRAYDSWHDLFLLQEHNGIIRAAYCTGGYRVAHVEGYAQVCQYPEFLKGYFQDP